MMHFNLLFTLFLFLSVYSLQDPCDPKSQRSLRSDQITVLINGYYESRIPLLQSIASTYANSPFVNAVVILWGNTSTPSKTLARLAHNLTASTTISLIRQSSSSLNARFLPHKSITTRAVLICDDDIEIDSKSVGFAFGIWGRNPDRLIGFFVRSHEIDLSKKEWMYTVHPDKYSIVLTKLMIMKTEYLFKYSCGGGEAMVGMRRIVDQVRNCEDILMNFVVADESNAGPVLIGGGRIRDWGDPRNDDDIDGAVGLSNKKGEHRKNRGWCINQFHRILGRMPLRYSYGKLVNSVVGEPSLCKKRGKLVFCDRF